MVNILKSMVLIFIFQFSGVAFPQTNAEHILVTGNPGSISFLREGQQTADPSEMVVGDIYSVRLRSLQLITGNIQLPKNLNIELTASHSSSIGSNKKIYVLLEVKGDEEYKALYWGVPQQIACVPKDLIEKANSQQAFRAFARYDGSQCVAF